MIASLRAPAILVALAFAIAVPPAAARVETHDPLVSVDLNRDVIIADVVERFGAAARAATPAGADALRAELAKLRADRLLAASLAGTYSGLRSMLLEAASDEAARLAPTRSKAFGDAARDLAYTPLSPCRLVDTRGFGAPIQGGAFAPGERRAYAPNGLCAVPAAGVASILVSVTTQNLTPASGGFLAVLAPNAPVSAIVDVFNLNSEWSGSNTVVATGTAGQFDVLVSTANAHVVVDVLGYFAPPPAGAVGTAQIADGSVTPAKLSAAGCTGNQVLRFNGTAWVCASLTPATLGCAAGDVVACYTGPPNTLGVGACKPGYRLCDTGTGTFSACTGQVLPAAEVADGIDNDCNGQVDDNLPVATVFTPEATLHGAAPIRYRLADPASAVASITPQYSIDGGVTWNAATRSGTLGDGTTGLATSPAGTPYVFFWNAQADGVATAGPVGSVRFRITPATSVSGAPADTAAFTVDNNLNRVIGVASVQFLRDGTERERELPIGDLLADALRAQAGTQLYLIDGGAIRASLPSSFAPSNPALRRSGAPPFDLVAGDAYTVLPFGNHTVTMTITGAQLHQALENGVSGFPARSPAFPQVSGFRFAFSASAPPGARVTSVTLAATNTPILADATPYTLGTSNFMGTGGDGYTVLAPLAKTTTYRIQADALLDYIVSQGTITTPVAGRVTQNP